ncbi:hypothetical protein D3C73_1374930 [compost metagenome]
MGLAGAVNDRRIEFVNGGGYEAYLAYSNSTSELKIRAGNDIRIDSGLYVTLSGMAIVLYGDSYVGNPISSNRIVVASELANKADASAAAYNLAFDTTTRNLKMYSKTGALLATVNIPA